MEPQGSETSAMESRGGERRLSAILAADMVGYSRLMEADETGTLARLRTHRLELIDPVIAKNKGRIIKTTGDGMLVEFQSVADAVECAAEIQRRMSRRNTDVSPARWIQYRIGINIGDVIVEDGDIFGDGVNVAARLQELAAPNGICVSAAVRDQVGDRLRLPAARLGLTNTPALAGGRSRARTGRGTAAFRLNGNRPLSMSASISDRVRTICWHSSVVSKPTCASMRAWAVEP